MSIIDPITPHLRQRAEEAVNAIAKHKEFKQPDSAKSEVKRLPGGRLHVGIEHDIIRDCSPKMLVWWFQHLAMKIDLSDLIGDGELIPMHLLWHHRDHCGVKAEGPGFAVGRTCRIRENFGIEYKVDVSVYCTRLDEREFNFDLLWHGRKAGEVTHKYEPVEGGCKYSTATTIGFHTPVIGRMPNWVARKFFYTEDNAQQWVKHNVEESGQTEKIVPFLYERFGPTQAEP